MEDRGKYKKYLNALASASERSDACLINHYHNLLSREFPAAYDSAIAMDDFKKV